MAYEELLKLAEKEDIAIYENNHIGRLEGLYVDNTITINTKLDTDIEKRCILAEELGHYYTSYGDIVDQAKLENRKQERKARAWAYDRLIGIMGLITAYKYGCKNKYEVAEFLNITEEFLEAAVTYYNEKYGQYYALDNYVVYFDPLGILELIWLSCEIKNKISRAKFKGI